MLCLKEQAGGFTSLRPGKEHTWQYVLVQHWLIYFPWSFNSGLSIGKGMNFKLRVIKQQCFTQQPGNSLMAMQRHFFQSLLFLVADPQGYYVVLRFCLLFSHCLFSVYFYGL
jgi:hypothetical protein